MQQPKRDIKAKFQPPPLKYVRVKAKGLGSRPKIVYQITFLPF